VTEGSPLCFGRNFEVDRALSQSKKAYALLAVGEGYLKLPEGALAEDPVVNL